MFLIFNTFFCGGAGNHQMAALIRCNFNFYPVGTPRITFLKQAVAIDFGGTARPLDTLTAA